MKSKTVYLLIIPMLFVALACSQTEQEETGVMTYTNMLDISYGDDVCDYTGKPIERVRFGGKITMKNGDIYRFRSAESTAAFLKTKADRREVDKVEIVDFAHGQKYLPADELVYLRSDLQSSPDGLYLTPVDASNERMKTYIYDAYPGPFYTWDEVLVLVTEEWNL